MPATEPSLLILIPAYNEEARIGPVLREYGRYFQTNYTGKFQVVVVLNGCRDNTVGVVREVAKEFPQVSFLDFHDPIGKGGALIEGLKLAPLADLIGYVDADGATGPVALHTLAKRLGEADCVIGSRWLPGAVLHQSQPWIRRVISRTGHFVVETLFGMRIQDTQCPCKILRRAAVEKIHSALEITDLAFDVNLLVSLHRAGLRVIEVPIEWTDKAGSKVSASLFRSSLFTFLSVLRIWLIYSRFQSLTRPLLPLQGWLYRKLQAARLSPGPNPEKKG